MTHRQNNQDGRSSKIIDLFLILGILGGIGYMVYFHADEVDSFKHWIGLGGAEEPNPPTAVSAPSQPSPLPVPSPAPLTTQSTNEIVNPPLVGQPRPALPAQDHWTWKTTDGKTYQEVKIEKIEDDYVTIIHATGGARIPISTLPDDLQKVLTAYSAQTQ